MSINTNYVCWSYLRLFVHYVILSDAVTYWSRRLLQGCIQISGVFRPKQVVSAGTQTESRVWALRLDSCASSSVSHAHSKWLPCTCCSVSYSNRGRLFNPEFVPAFRNTQYITNRDSVRAWQLVIRCRMRLRCGTKCERLF